MQKLLTLVVLSVFVGTGAFASDKKKSSSSSSMGSPLQPNDGYGAAGCGLGSMIFKDNKGISQILAATTNGTSGNQTFGISSGTLNCKVDGFTKKEMNDTYFAEANFRDLKVELAQGSGEHLMAFAQVLGCNDSVAPAFGKMTHKNYKSIFPSHDTNANQMLSNVKSAIQADEHLSKECKPLS